MPLSLGRVRCWFWSFRAAVVSFVSMLVRVWCWSSHRVRWFRFSMLLVGVGCCRSPLFWSFLRVRWFRIVFFSVFGAACCAAHTELRRLRNKLAVSKYLPAYTIRAKRPAGALDSLDLKGPKRLPLSHSGTPNGWGRNTDASQKTPCGNESRHTIAHTRPKKKSADRRDPSWRCLETSIPFRAGFPTTRPGGQLTL